MKKLGVLFCAVAIATATIVIAGDEKPFFDLTNCSICKNIGQEEGLMENVKWESHKISNGMLSISSVSDEYKEKWERAHSGMKSVISKLEGGEQVPLCGYCMTYGSLMMAGAKQEDIETEHGHIGLMTSENPEVVAKIHSFMDRTEVEWEKYMESQQGS